MLLWLAQSALAEPLIHHDPAPEIAIERAQSTGATGPFEPQTLESVRAANPWMRAGSEVVGPCKPGEIDAEAVRGHLLYGEYAEASAKLVIERTKCSGSAEQRARLERTAGILKQLQGETDAGLSFSIAKGHNPELGWDEGFPESQAAAFHEAKPAQVHLDVVPTGAMIDRVPVSKNPIADGVHAVQFGDEGHIVQLFGTDDVLVVPAAYPTQIMALGAEPARRDLSFVLAAALGEGKRVSVLAPDGLWSGTTGRVDWSVLPYPAVTKAHLEPAGDVAPKKKSKAPWWVAAGGGLVAGAGYTLAGISAGQAHEANDELGAPLSKSAYDEVRERGKAANQRVWIGQGVGAAGLGLTTVGVVWGVWR